MALTQTDAVETLQHHQRRLQAGRDIGAERVPEALDVVLRALAEVDDRARAAQGTTTLLTATQAAHAAAVHELELVQVRLACLEEEIADLRSRLAP